MRWSAYRKGGALGSGPWTVTAHYTDGNKEDFVIRWAGGSPSRAMNQAKVLWVNKLCARWDVDSIHRLLPKKADR